jgi:hypothetical protein
MDDDPRVPAGLAEKVLGLASKPADARSSRGALRLISEYLVAKNDLLNRTKVLSGRAGRRLLETVRVQQASGLG